MDTAGWLAHRDGLPTYITPGLIHYVERRSECISWTDLVLIMNSCQLYRAPTRVLMVNVILLNPRLIVCSVKQSIGLHVSNLGEKCPLVTQARADRVTHSLRAAHLLPWRRSAGLDSHRQATGTSHHRLATELIQYQPGRPPGYRNRIYVPR